MSDEFEANALDRHASQLLVVVLWIIVVMVAVVGGLWLLVQAWLWVQTLD